MIESLELKSFTVFEHLEIKFSPKINIIIGENGAGKTHLIKAAYALQFSCSELHVPNAKKHELEEAVTEKLINIFRPIEMKLGKLRRRGASENTFMKAGFDLDRNVALNFHLTSKEVDVQSIGQNLAKPIFIPTKEILSFMKGMSDPDSDADTVRRIFDDSYMDMYEAINSRIEKDIDSRINTEPRFGTVYPRLVNAIGGKYEFKDGNYLFRPGTYEEVAASRASDEKRSGGSDEAVVNNQDAEGVGSGDQYEIGDKFVAKFTPYKGDELSNNMTAEGFRKIGVLQQLLANQRLDASRCVTLYWDEPESNLNPKLAKFLVSVILELSRNGLQIILATHDYVLLKWFDLLLDKKKDDHVRFHVLQRDIGKNSVKLKSTDEYGTISPNAIFDTFSALTDREIAKSMGVLGK